MTTAVTAMSKNVYCQCTIDRGAFALSLHDLRLKIKGKDECSSATLHINKHEFSCVPSRLDFGSEFGRIFHHQMKNAYINFGYNSEDVVPEMVWIIGKPKGNACVIFTSWKAIGAELS